MGAHFSTQKWAPLSPKLLLFHIHYFLFCNKGSFFIVVLPTTLFFMKKVCVMICFKVNRFENMALTSKFCHLLIKRVQNEFVT